jgi:phosphatidylinositol phospholipase C delta
VAHKVTTLSLNESVSQTMERLQALADKDVSGTLSVDELNSLFKKINLNISKKQISKLMEPYHTKELSKEQFKDLYTKLAQVPGFSILHQKITSSTGFEQFWTYIQKEPRTTTPSLQEFTDYLLHDENNLYSFEKRKLYMDMSQPWYKYYMNSSHNTYLTGNQLSGESSTQAYVRALQMGCRCVELDCWDGPGGEPIITHGYTLTSDIFFKDVVEIAHKYAFVASPYPVVLSLEVHCSTEQQDRMAEILTSILGSTLVTDRLDPGKVVSPENLKHRIILKGRALANQEISPDEESDTETIPEQEKPKEKVKKVKISPKLAALIVYQQAKKLHQVEDVNQFENHHVSSFSEAKASRMISKTIEEFLRFTSTAFARCFALI